MKRLWERGFFSQNNQIEKFINKVADLKSACESDTNIIKVSRLDKKTSYILQKTRNQNFARSRILKQFSSDGID